MNRTRRKPPPKKAIDHDQESDTTATKTHDARIKTIDPTRGEKLSPPTKNDDFHKSAKNGQKVTKNRWTKGVATNPGPCQKSV